MQWPHLAHPVLVRYALSKDLFLFHPLLLPNPSCWHEKNISKVFGDNSKEFIKMALCQGTQNNMPLKTCPQSRRVQNFFPTGCIIFLRCLCQQCHFFHRVHLTTLRSAWNYVHFIEGELVAQEFHWPASEDASAHSRAEKGIQLHLFHVLSTWPAFPEHQTLTNAVMIVVISTHSLYYYSLNIFKSKH